jgi:hypothetical protein
MLGAEPVPTYPDKAGYAVLVVLVPESDSTLALETGAGADVGGADVGGADVGGADVGGADVGEVLLPAG